MPAADYGVYSLRADVGFWGLSGNVLLGQSITGFDPIPTSVGLSISDPSGDRPRTQLPAGAHSRRH